MELSNLRQAAQQALEALDNERYVSKYSHIVEAITVLRAALAEPNKCTHGVEDSCKECYMAAEPVAWMYECVGDTRFAKKLDTPGMHRTESVPLYTAPPQRNPLTEEEIEREWASAPSVIDFTRALERAHGIGEKK